MKPGKNIRKRRKAAGLTQVQLCEKVKPPIPQSLLSEVESGKTSPTLRTLERIARALKCKVRDLL